MPDRLLYEGDRHERLDMFVARVLPHLSRTRIQAFIEQGHILVNQRRVKASMRLEHGDSILVQEPPGELGQTPSDEDILPLPIVFEDEQLLLVDKPAGIVVHPAPGHAGGTLVDALLAHDPTLAMATLAGGEQRPGIVHRLDKDTSGLLVVAKTPIALMGLARQFQAHTVIKRYLALVEGHLPVAEGAIEAPIGRDRSQRQRMAITAQHGRYAHTLFWVEREYGRFTLVSVQIVTGRTHQIRVHFAAIRHPVAGDPLYGHLQQAEPPRLFLHAAELQFTHPTTGQQLKFTSPLPPDLTGFLASL